MTGCYFCNTPLAKGQGVRRNVRTGTSVPGLYSVAPTFFLVFLAVLAGRKPPSIRSYFGLRTLCANCGQRLDVRRALWRKILLSLIGLMFIFAVALISAKH